jgi:hypothetical protein
MLLKNKCKNLRRKVALKDIVGVTMSYHHESSEMVIHVRKEPDIRVASPGHRKQLLDTFKVFCYKQTKMNLPIYGVRQKSLDAY